MVIPGDLGTRSYSIVVEPGALASVGMRLRELRVGSRTVVMTDARILKVHGAAVVASLEAAGLAVTVLEVPDGEAAKTLAGAGHRLGPLLAGRAGRTSPIPAPGGRPGGRPPALLGAADLPGRHL